jgi:hypothetical protein
MASFSSFCQKDQGNRPNKFLSVGWVVRLHVDQDGWFKKGARRAEATTSQQNLRAVTCRLVNLAKDELESGARR